MRKTISSLLCVAALCQGVQTQATPHRSGITRERAVTGTAFTGLLFSSAVSIGTSTQGALDLWQVAQNVENSTNNSTDLVDQTYLMRNVMFGQAVLMTVFGIVIPILSSFSNQGSNGFILGLFASPLLNFTYNFASGYNVATTILGPVAQIAGAQPANQLMQAALELSYEASKMASIATGSLPFTSLVAGPTMGWITMAGARSQMPAKNVELQEESKAAEEKGNGSKERASQVRDSQIVEAENV